MDDMSIYEAILVLRGSLKWLDETSISKEMLDEIKQAVRLLWDFVKASPEAEELQNKQK